MFSRLLDRLVLRPTTESIDPGQRKRELIQTPNGPVEAWCIRSNDFQAHDAQPQVQGIAIKFPGTGGRAERCSPQPLDVCSSNVTEVWTINHIGYGGSGGTATLKNYAATCDAIWQHLTDLHPSLPITLVGNSLGCVSALYLAAHYDVAGIFLRNPVPLQQMIATRPKYNWWNFGLAGWIANHIPNELDAVANAKKSTCPLLMIRSEFDRVVPARYQQMILENYGGDKSEFVIPDADHHHPVPESEIENYLMVLRLWCQRLTNDLPGKSAVTKEVGRKKDAIAPKLRQASN